MKKTPPRHTDNVLEEAAYMNILISLALGYTRYAWPAGCGTAGFDRLAYAKIAIETFSWKLPPH